MKVIAYLRVSTDTQVEDGSSLAAQRGRLEAYCKAMELDLVEVIEDAGYSAKSLERPGIKRACRLLDEGRADGLLVIRLDRLTRSIKDLWWLLERYFVERPTIRRCTLMSMNDAIDTRTAGGRLVLNVLASVSAWEREVISERTRETLAHLKANGQKLGRPSLETTYPQVGEKIRELYATGQYTLHSLAAKLNRDGVRTYDGKSWYPTTIARILKRQRAA